MPKSVTTTKKLAKSGEREQKRRFTHVNYLQVPLHGVPFPWALFDSFLSLWAIFKRTRRIKRELNNFHEWMGKLFIPYFIVFQEFINTWRFGVWDFYSFNTPRNFSKDIFLVLLSWEPLYHKSFRVKHSGGHSYICVCVWFWPLFWHTKQMWLLCLFKSRKHLWQSQRCSFIWWMNQLRTGRRQKFFIEKLA